MRKIKLERITGIVALSYLVLIPAGAIYALRKLKIVEEGLVELAKGHVP